MTDPTLSQRVASEPRRRAMALVFLVAIIAILVSLLVSKAQPAFVPGNPLYKYVSDGGP